MTLLVVTNLFPNPLEPQRSTFNERQLLALAQREPLQVIAPVDWVRKLAFLRRGRLGELRRCRDWRGLPVRYPTYWYVPKFLAWTRGFTLALSLLPAMVGAARPRAILATWAYPDGFAALLIGRALRVPVTIKVHGSDVESLDEGGWHAALARWALRRADGVVSVSRYLRDRLLAHGVDPARIAVVANGVDADGFRPGDRGAARSELGLAGEGRLVLYVGNLKADKGLPELVDPRVVAACREAGASLAIVGDGPYRAVLERRIREEGLADSIRLLGRLPPERIARWMNAADCLSLPSHHEGIPNVILEALSCGLPVVATRVGGIPEVLDPAGGVLVEPRDPVSLAEGIRAALGARWDRDAVRTSCPAGDWDASADALLNAIKGRTL